MVWRFLKWGGNLKPKSILVVVTFAWSICFRFVWCSGALERRELTVKRDQSTTETPVCAGLCTLKFAFWFVFGTCWLDIHLPCIYTLLMCEIQEERFCGSPATLCSSVTPMVESLLSDFNLLLMSTVFRSFRWDDWKCLCCRTDTDQICTPCVDCCSERSCVNVA